jgi:NitT/TauT family transport system substrate-binding protein
MEQGGGNMRTKYSTLIGGIVGAALLALNGADSRAADQISISNYGVAPGSFPWAIAQEKGFFKKHGVEISAIRSSPGSAPTIREMIAGNLPFAEAGITGAIAAIKSGAEIKVIASTVNTFSEVIWVTMPDSPVKTIKDIKGRKVGFTSPKSATNMMAVLLLKKAGLKQDEAQLIAAGSFAQALTALDTGGIDVIPMVEPTFSVRGSKYRILARGNETFPPMSNVLGLTTAKVAKERPDVLKGILAARREALAWMLKNPKESSEILTKAWKVDAAILEKVIVQLRDHGAVDKVAYWGEGKIELKALENMLEGAMTTGEITEAFDVRKIIDESFLPADLRSKK